MLLGGKSSHDELMLLSVVGSQDEKIVVSKPFDRQLVHVTPQDLRGVSESMLKPLGCTAFLKPHKDQPEPEEWPNEDAHAEAKGTNRFTQRDSLEDVYGH